MAAESSVSTCPKCGLSYEDHEDVDIEDESQSDTVRWDKGNSLNIAFSGMCLDCMYPDYD